MRTIKKRLEELEKKQGKGIPFRLVTLYDGDPTPEFDPDDGVFTMVLDFRDSPTEEEEKEHGQS